MGVLFIVLSACKTNWTCYQLLNTNCTRSSERRKMAAGNHTGVAVFLLVLNIFLSLTAILGNILILFALYKVSSLHSPTKLLFLCLAVTDLFIGLISQPLFAVAIMSEIPNVNLNPLCLYYVGRVNSSSSYILCVVSILTSTAISVDRLFALLLGLRYRYVVTSRRVFVVIIWLRFIGVSCGSLYLWRNDVAWSVAMVVIIISLVTSASSYIKIYRKLCYQQRQVHSQREQNLDNRKRFKGGRIERYRKTVAGIWWVQLAILACYIPFVIVATLRIHGGIYGDGLQMARRLVVTFIYFNSSLNPILYCWTIAEVRQVVKDAIWR